VIKQWRTLCRLRSRIVTGNRKNRNDKRFTFEFKPRIRHYEKNQAIKPGPKPKKEDGSDDRRHRADPPTQPKHPGLKRHIHKPGEKR